MSSTIQYKQLLKQLTIKEIKQRYKDSFLGVLWILINPLSQLVILSFVFSNLFGRGEIDGVPFTLFMFAGLLPWTFFSTALEDSTNSLVKNSQLLSKIWFPRRVFVESMLISKTVDFLFSSVVFVMLCLIYNFPFHFSMLLFFALLPIQIVFMYSLSLIFSIVNVYYRDTQYLLSIIIKMWFYLTPIVYPADLFPDRYRWIFILNPMAVLINAFRKALLNQGTFSFVSLGIMSIMILILFLVSWSLFHRLEKNVGDIV